MIANGGCMSPAGTLLIEPPNPPAARPKPKFPVVLLLQNHPPGLWVSLPNASAWAACALGSKSKFPKLQTAVYRSSPNRAWSFSQPLTDQVRNDPSKVTLCTSFLPIHPRFFSHFALLPLFRQCELCRTWSFFFSARRGTSPSSKRKFIAPKKSVGVVYLRRFPAAFPLLSSARALLRRRHGRQSSLGLASRLQQRIIPKS